MKVLSPGMQHRQKADPGTEVPSVGGDLQQGFGGGAEENASARGCTVSLPSPRK